MKTGIVVLVTANGEKSKIVSEVIPLEEATEKARALQGGNKGADGFDFVEVWSGAMRRFALPKPPEPPAKRESLKS